MSTDGREELRRPVRVDEALPADVAVVIRGGPDTRSLLSTHARRLHRAFVLDGGPVFGVSVFVALDDLGPASERGILSSKLRKYPTIYRCTAGELSDHGLVLLPTFARPHYTIVQPDLGAVDALDTVLGRLRPNPYAEA